MVSQSSTIFYIIYSINGTHGRLVASVELDPGNYVKEFEPWGGSGYFVWRPNHLDAFADTHDMGIGGLLAIYGFVVAGIVFLMLFTILLIFFILGKLVANKSGGGIQQVVSGDEGEL